MNQHSRSYTDWLLLAGLCGFLFFWGLGYFGLIGADEPRYAQVAREMLARRNWVTPFLDGKPWLEKPVLYYWETMLVYSIAGVSDWAARVPAALNATLMSIAVYLFLRRFRPGFQLDGALMTASAAPMAVRAVALLHSSPSRTVAPGWMRLRKSLASRTSVAVFSSMTWRCFCDLYVLKKAPSFGIGAWLSCKRLVG